MNIFIIIEAIIIFDKYLSKAININPSSEVSLITKIVFLFDVAARLVWKCQNLHQRIIWLINNNNMLIISYTSGNTTRAIFLDVILDFEPQWVIINKWLSQKLDLTPTDLKPYFFTIITWVGGTKQATRYTRQSLQLIFYIGSSPYYSYLFLKYIVISTTN